MTSSDGRRGAPHYDSLDDAAQAEVRATWGDRIAARRAALDLGAHFEAAGRPYAVLGEDGEVVIRNAG
jgi:hypothetical protein